MHFPNRSPRLHTIILFRLKLGHHCRKRANAGNLKKLAPKLNPKKQAKEIPPLSVQLRSCSGLLGDRLLIISKTYLEMHILFLDSASSVAFRSLVRLIWGKQFFFAGRQNRYARHRKYFAGIAYSLPSILQNVITGQVACDMVANRSPESKHARLTNHVVAEKRCHRAGSLDSSGRVWKERQHSSGTSTDSRSRCEVNCCSTRVYVMVFCNLLSEVMQDGRKVCILVSTK